MPKFLFTAWPYPGSLLPQISVAHALVARGHKVGFYTGTRAAGLIQGEGFHFFPLGASLDKQIEDSLSSPRGIGSGWQRPWRVSETFKTWLLETIPGQLADLHRILETWKPDAIICERAMWSPFVILHEARRIPVALLEYAACVLPGPDVSPQGMGLPLPRNRRYRLLAKLVSISQELIARDPRRFTNHFRKQYGLPSLNVKIAELPGKLPLVLVPSSPEFDYMRRDLPPSVKYVGPCSWYPSTWSESDWLNELPHDRPWVHVTEGTFLSSEPVILRAAVKGLADLPVQVILTTGTQRKGDRVDLGRLPSNMVVKPMVAHSELMPRLDVLVFQGGGGTTISSLAEGVPMVVVPLMWDQMENAQRVSQAGAGVRLSSHLCSPRRLRKAVERVLNGPAYRENAQRLAESLRRFRGPVQAAELLENMI